MVLLSLRTIFSMREPLRQSNLLSAALNLLILMRPVLRLSAFSSRRRSSIVPTASLIMRRYFSIDAKAEPCGDGTSLVAAPPMACSSSPKSTADWGAPGSTAKMAQRSRSCRGPMLAPAVRRHARSFAPDTTSASPGAASSSAARNASMSAVSLISPSAVRSSATWARRSSSRRSKLILPDPCLSSSAIMGTTTSGLSSTSSSRSAALVSRRPSLPALLRSFDSKTYDAWATSSSRDPPCAAMCASTICTARS